MLSLIPPFSPSEGTSLEALVPGSACFAPLLHPSLFVLVCFFFYFFLCCQEILPLSLLCDSALDYSPPTFHLQPRDMWHPCVCVCVFLKLYIWPFVSTSVLVMLLITLTPTPIHPSIHQEHAWCVSLDVCEHEWTHMRWILWVDVEPQTQSTR